MSVIVKLQVWRHIVSVLGVVQLVVGLGYMNMPWANNITLRWVGEAAIDYDVSVLLRFARVWRRSHCGQRCRYSLRTASKWA